MKTFTDIKETLSVRDYYASIDPVIEALLCITWADLIVPLDPNDKYDIAKIDDAYEDNAHIYIWEYRFAFSLEDWETLEQKRKQTLEFLGNATLI
jgi:hypothetical protein